MTSQPYGGYGNSVLQQRAPAGVVHYTLQAPICLTVSVTRALCLCLSVSVSLPVRLSFSLYCRPRLRIWFLSRTMLRSCDAQSHQSQPEMWQRMQLLESEIIIFSDSSKSLQVIATAEWNRRGNNGRKWRRKVDKNEQANWKEVTRWPKDEGSIYKKWRVEMGENEEENGRKWGRNINRNQEQKWRRNGWKWKEKWTKVKKINRLK